MSAKIEGPRLTPLPPTPASDAIDRRSKASGDDKVGSAAATDSVRLTDTATQLAAVVRSGAEQAPFDAAKVEAVKAALANGTFKMDAQTIARQLIAAEQAMLK